jgi:hypothetical protein
MTPLEADAGVPVKWAAMTPRRVHPAFLAFATLAVVGAGLASPAGVASATPLRVGATAKAVPQVEDCGMGKNLVEPKTLVLACADANGQAVSLVWTKWDSTTARATGVYTWNICEPNCAASNKWGRTSADFGLGDAVHARQGWLFEELTVHITGANWHEPRTWTLSEKPIPT